MRGAALVAAALPIAMLAACASKPLSRDDASRTCQVIVKEAFGEAVLSPNPLSSSGGGFAGAGRGALYGGTLGFPLSIIGIPLGAVMGAGYGTACAAAGAERPTAHADFERIFREATASALRQAIVAGTSTPRSECADVAEHAAPGAVIEIGKVEGQLGCLFGQQEYLVAVHWRTVDAANARVLAADMTVCRVRSPRTVDEWFGDAAHAKTEIERVLAAAGRRIAQDARIPTSWNVAERASLPRTSCDFGPGEGGTLVPR